MKTLLEESLLNALRWVSDPELDCNIVDLGLIYGITNDAGKVTVTMTLTTPGCPMHDSIAEGVKCALLNLEGVENVEVNVVWEPPWNPGLMSDAGRARMGLLLP